MILVDKATLKFLLAGRQITAHVHREHRKGGTYSVGVHHNRTICRAQVVSSSQTADGWIVEIRRVMEDTPRLLARNPAAQRADYVAEPSRAAFEEPEALSDEQLSDIRLHACQQDTLRTAERAVTLGSMSPSQRLAHLERVRARVRIDIGDELRIIERFVTRAEKRLRS